MIELISTIPPIIKEIADLTKIQQKALKEVFDIIETKCFEYVKWRHLCDGLFEIKTNDVRALFVFQENCIILIGLVYKKRSNKAPDYYIKLVQKCLKEV